MKVLFRKYYLYLLTTLCLPAMANAKLLDRKYISPNHKFCAVIHSTQAVGEMPESVVSVYDSRGKLVKRKSYTSPDHEHGYSVVQLKWSADSTFCVWSLTSSGGHSPWHFPTDCFIQKCKQVVNIDSKLNCGLSKSEFKLKAPHIFLSQRLIPNPNGDPKFADVKLDLATLACS